MRRSLPSLTFSSRALYAYRGERENAAAQAGLWTEEHGGDTASPTTARGRATVSHLNVLPGHGPVHKKEVQVVRLQVLQALVDLECSTNRGRQRRRR